MEETEENLNEVVGRLQITVYNDCFSVEHTANLSTEDIIDLFTATLEKLTGALEETEDRVVH
jgi:hypothetical protein